jgi:hypothetical protein
MGSALFAAMVAALGVWPGLFLPFVVWGPVVRGVGAIVGRARGLPPRDPCDDPTPSERVELAIAFALATATGVIAALLFGWMVVPGARPTAAILVALTTGSLSGIACGAVAWRIPAAAGFSTMPAVVVGAAVAASVAAVGAAIS